MNVSSVCVARCMHLSDGIHSLFVEDSHLLQSNASLRPVFLITWFCKL